MDKERAEKIYEVPSTVWNALVALLMEQPIKNFYGLAKQCELVEAQANTKLNNEVIPDRKQPG